MPSDVEKGITREELAEYFYKALCSTVDGDFDRKYYGDVNFHVVLKQGVPVGFKLDASKSWKGDQL